MDDYRRTLNAVGWTLVALSTFFVAARSYIRTRVVTTKLERDDWCMIIAWAFAIACTSLVTVGTTCGLGRHIWDIRDPDDQDSAAFYALVAPCLSILCAFFTKASIIMALMRIRGKTASVLHKCIAYIPLAVLLAGSALACSITMAFCSPVQKSWRPHLEGSCMSPAVSNGVSKSVSIYNAAMDVLCATMPYFIFRSLNIPRKDKRNLMILMGGSIVGMFATVMKIVAMRNISHVADLTYSWSETTIWYLTENNILIIAGSFPALRPLWRIGMHRCSQDQPSTADRDIRQEDGHRPALKDLELQDRDGESKVVLGRGCELYITRVQEDDEEGLWPQWSTASLNTADDILTTMETAGMEATPKQ